MERDPTPQKTGGEGESGKDEWGHCILVRCAWGCLLQEPERVCEELESPTYGLLPAMQTDFSISPSSVRDVPEKAGAVSHHGAPREVQRGLKAPPARPPTRPLADSRGRAEGPGLPQGQGRAGRGRPGGPGAAGRCWRLWARSQAGAFSRLTPPAQPLRPSRGWVPAQELSGVQRHRPPSIAAVPPTLPLSLPQSWAHSASHTCQLPPKAGDS